MVYSNAFAAWMMRQGSSIPQHVPTRDISAQNVAILLNFLRSLAIKMELRLR